MHPGGWYRDAVCSPRADDLLANAELTAKIIEEIQRRRLTHSQAAILGIDQPKLSALKQDKPAGFSIEPFMRLAFAARARDGSRVRRGQLRADESGSFTDFRRA